ncbi:Hemerythrin-like domain-containing protein [uncultured Gammaproteobacteria bacterium]
MSMELQWDLVEWSDSFRTGNSVMDADHQHLLEIFNRFATAANEGRGEEFALGIQEELAEYTDYHFNNEETLMREHNYPDYEVHKRLHDRFRKQISVIGNQCGVGSDVGTFLLSFLSHWLIGHILNADRRLGDFLRGRAMLHH